VDVHPVTPDRWDDMVALFERRGPRGGYRNSPAYGCWCMFWRKRTGDGAANKRNMAALVRGGREPGLLAYEDGEPVGWVAVAPRPEHAVLLRSPQYRPQDEDEGIWSITCFTVDKQARGRGLKVALLDAAIEHAFARGAAAVEAYAHLTDGRDYMGVVGLYERHGFERVRETSKRAVVRLPSRSSGRR
jgi:ribosomal protein S18 acetylase RimI-like enzyme